MASSTRSWALFVLAVSWLAACRGQDVRDVPDVGYLGQMGYEVEAEAGTDPNEEITVIHLANSNKNADEFSVTTDASIEIEEEVVKEPIAVRKKVPCLGCPINVDISVPENLKALHKLLQRPLSTMDSTSEFKFSTPNILSATKQVESSIKYTIVFEVLGTWCSSNDPSRNRDECPLQPEERRTCEVEIIDKNGAQDVTYNNCSIGMENQMFSKNWESHESAYHGIVPSSDGKLRSVDLKTSDLIQSNEGKWDDLEESMGDNSQENEDSQEVEDIRERRSTNFGALRDVDKSEQDLISQFAELAVKTLDEVDPDNTKRVVLGVTEAKKQIVNGILYHLVIKVGTSTCQENEGGHSNTNCVENQLYPEKVCRVQIHRSWADEAPLNAKVVKSECADVWPNDFPYEPLPSERIRRGAQENWPSTDGWKKYELNDRSQGDCFDKVMTSFQDVLHVKDVTKVATIRDAHTRVNKESFQPEMVVTIVLTDPAKLKMLGDVKKPMVVSSRVICTQRLKRSPGIPGGLSDANVDDPDVKENTKFAMSEIQKSINSPYQHSLVRIIEARRQVVAGTLYHFKFEIAPTSCFKTDQQNKDCVASTNSEICTLQVWHQPWTGLQEIKDLKCGSSRSKREVTESEEEPARGRLVLGGLQTQDVEDPYVKELASFALAEIDRGLNSPYQQKVIRVVDAKSQVVSGTLMHLKLELVTTNCLKNENVPSENCVYDADKETTMCSLKVWDRVWLNKRLLQDVQCGRARAKRDISAVEVDVKDPYIIESANFALAEIDKQTNTPYHHKLVGIHSAEVEHSSVSKVKMSLEVGYSSCRKSSQSLECSLQKDLGVKICRVQLKHSPLLQLRELVSLKCSPAGAENYPQSAHNSLMNAGDGEDLAAASFRDFMHRFNKTYSSDAELQRRFNVFKANLRLISRLQRGEQGTAVYGPTIFADLSPKEFKEKYTGLRQDLRQENAVPMPLARIPNIKVPTSFDWRDHNAVTPVKNQGACGSCWAFAVTGNLEGQYAIKHGKLLSFSEQELVDCDTLDDGCKGGLPDNAYHALEQLGGIETESDYPYEGEDDQCHFNRSEVKVQVKSAVNITTNEVDMAKWLVKNGPIAIGINANAMQFYMGGVSHPFKFLCSPGNLDHGVLIVGHGVHTTSFRHKVLPYWLVKNSWGTFWGEKGYYRVYRGDGTCGVNQMASSAVID